MFQDPPTFLTLHVNGITILLACLTCMTSQSSLSRSSRAPVRGTSSSPSSSSSSPSSSTPPPPSPQLSDCPQGCNNHGDCVWGDNHDVIHCRCHVGWSGFACGQLCDKLCVNGKCQIVRGHAQKCICSLGYYGDRCQHKDQDVSAFLKMSKLLSQVMWNRILPLIQDPSQKLEKLIQSGSSYCSSTFRCQNGGKCKHGDTGGYRCQCASTKYAGDFCQFTCPRPCVNGGKCIRYREESSAPASDVTTLPPRPPTNSAWLTDGSQLQYACVCPKEFYGRFCQRKRIRSSSTPYLK